jgi:predicted nuclease of predicted toxin-antitoxin system
MNVLLDENIPRKLQWRLKERGIEVVTVPDRGWTGVTNGELLSRADGEFDALLTMDQGIEYQQNIQDRSLGVVTIVAPDNEYETLLPLVPNIESALQELEAGRVVSVTP